MTQLDQIANTVQEMAALLGQMTATLSDLQADGHPAVTTIGTIPVAGNDLADPGVDPLTPLRVEVERHPGEATEVVITIDGWAECISLSVEGARVARDLFAQAVRVAEGTETFTEVTRG